jgi:glycosyltransferase involved in cell wall biosynthesis
MKIVFIASSPFGMQGTPGTYKLVESFSKIADVTVFSKKNVAMTDHIVFTEKGNYFVNEVDFKNRKEWVLTIEQIVSLRPEIVYFCSGQIWCRDEAEIILKIKTQLPSTRFVLDLKSPPLIDDRHQLNEIRRTYAKHQCHLDKIFSRCIEDVEAWFENISCDVSIYPLGVPVNDFRPVARYRDTILCRKFIYIGAIDNRRHLDRLFSYIAEFQPNLKSVFSLDLYGSGRFFNTAKTIIERSNLEDIISLNPGISQKDLFDLLPEYDAGIAWVPYEKYDSAPSLKSLEYIASGLVPLVSDTIAHQRLANAGFHLSFYSHDQHSFETSVATLCYHGMPASKISHNMEMIKGHDWDIVVNNHIFPELKKMTHHSDIDRFCIRHSKNDGTEPAGNFSVMLKKNNIISQNDHTVAGQNKMQDILFLFENKDMINFAEKLFFKALSINSSMNIGIGTMDDTSFPSNHSRSVVVFYRTGEISRWLEDLFEMEIPVILSEKSMPQRIILNWAVFAKKEIHEAYWLREMLLSRANKIILENGSYSRFVPEYLRDRVCVFYDNPNKYFDSGRKQHMKTTVDFWQKLINEVAKNEIRPLSSGGPKSIHVERQMHAGRMRKKIVTNFCAKG